MRNNQKVSPACLSPESNICFNYHNILHISDTRFSHTFSSRIAKVIWSSLAYLFLFFLIEFIEVTLVNKSIQVSTVQFYNTSPVYYIVCPPPKAKSPSLPFEIAFPLLPVTAGPYHYSCILSLVLQHIVLWPTLFFTNPQRKSYDLASESHTLTRMYYAHSNKTTRGKNCIILNIVRPRLRTEPILYQGFR